MKPESIPTKSPFTEALISRADFIVDQSDKGFQRMFNEPALDLAVVLNPSVEKHAVWSIAVVTNSVLKTAMDDLGYPWDYIPGAAIPKRPRVVVALAIIMAVSCHSIMDREGVSLDLRAVIREAAGYSFLLHSDEERERQIKDGFDAYLEISRSESKGVEQWMKHLMWKLMPAYVLNWNEPWEEKESVDFQEMFSKSFSLLLEGNQ